MSKLTKEQKRVMDNWLEGYEPVKRMIQGQVRNVGYIKGTTVRWVVKNERQRIFKSDSYAKDKDIVDDWVRNDAIDHFQILDLTEGNEYSILWPVIRQTSEVVTLNARIGPQYHIPRKNFEVKQLHLPPPKQIPLMDKDAINDLYESKG